MTQQMKLPDAAVGLMEATSQAIAQNIQWANIELPTGTVPTSYVCQGEGVPILLLHGFDSSLFEFRRLVPELAKNARVWAMDLFGFGFCDRTATPEVNPALIKQHILAFCQQVIGQPVVLVGASMGGGAAIDFATSHSEMVNQLILIDAVGFAAGPAVGKFMFSPWTSGLPTSYATKAFAAKSAKKPTTTSASSPQTLPFVLLCTY